jgi:conflict system STAND superfamily ATPase
MSNKKNDVEEFPFQIDEFYLDLQADGSKISLLPIEEIIKRPFPGLRPFKTAEFQLFKGRGGQAEELIKRLNNNHFLAVIGSSGTGKSSLVRAGLIPQLFGGYLHAAGNRWDIAICRPGKDPVENLAISLASVKSRSTEKEDILTAYKEIKPLLSNSIYGVVQVTELLNKDEQEDEPANLLIIIDQFEELFRFDRKDLGNDNIENHFVNLLLKASSLPASPVYVIITMRSEFLGDCVKYRGLPEAINSAQYLVPQLNRDQLKEVIQGPINLAGKKIAPGLVELLINEIEESKLKENLDQLPIMQHALMRTYNEAMRHGPDTEISFDHYQTIGGMEHALANHAEAKYEELHGNTNDLSTRQRIAKLVFQAITDMSTDDKGGRRPVSLQTIYEIAAAIEASQSDVNKVINHFRDDETSFIMPPASTALYPALVMDISHESLMRNWDRLKDWITEEVNAGKLYKTLNERRELFVQYQEGYLKGGLLSEIMEWKAVFPGCPAWASRYVAKGKKTIDKETNKKLYEENLVFLNKSYDESRIEKEKEKKELKAAIDRAARERRGKRAVIILSVIVISSLTYTIYNSYENRRNSSVAYNQILTLESQADSIQKRSDSVKQFWIAKKKTDSLNQMRYSKTSRDSLFVADSLQRVKNDSLAKESTTARKKVDSLKNYINSLNDIRVPRRREK